MAAELIKTLKYSNYSDRGTVHMSVIMASITSNITEELKFFTAMQTVTELFNILPRVNDAFETKNL